MSDPVIRVCSMCGKAYGPEYADTFCLCGFELLPPAPAAAAPAAAPARAPSAPARLPPERPASGTRCLVLYGADKLPVQYFPLVKDATLIGRQDPLEATFPDIDLSQWLDSAAVRRISRQHALVLHSRTSDSFSIRPLPGNTGTQLENDMIPAQQDLPLRPGCHLILGGAARLKFEIV